MAKMLITCEVWKTAKKVPEKNLQKDLEVSKKSLPLHPQSRKQDCNKFWKILAVEKFFKIFLRKIWRLKKSPYLCSPFEYERRRR